MHSQQHMLNIILLIELYTCKWNGFAIEWAWPTILWCIMYYIIDLSGRHRVLWHAHSSTLRQWTQYIHVDTNCWTNYEVATGWVCQAPPPLAGDVPPVNPGKSFNGSANLVIIRYMYWHLYEFGDVYQLKRGSNCKTRADMNKIVKDHINAINMVIWSQLSKYY